LKIHPPPIIAESYCKESFITRNYAHPTNQYVVACMVRKLAADGSGHNRGTVQSEDARLVLARDTPHKMCQNRGLRQTHAAPPTSAPRHIGKRRAVAGVGAIGEQVASKQSKRATCRSYYYCCTVLLLYYSVPHIRPPSRI